MIRPTAVRTLVASMMVLASLSTKVHAQTSVTVPVRDFTGSPFTFTPFTVTAPGIFTFATRSTVPTDPFIFLFRGSSTTGAGLGALVASNDDAFTLCGSANFADSCILSVLGLNDFTLAQGLFPSTEADARANRRGDGGTGTFDVRYTTLITSPNGRIAFGTTATPEPASMVLLATGLAGVFGATRRKRNEKLSA